MKFVLMRNVCQRWSTLTSRVFRVTFQPERGRERSVDVVKVRGLLYPAGVEPDRDESQIEDWEVHPRPEEVEATI